MQLAAGEKKNLSTVANRRLVFMQLKTQMTADLAYVLKVTQEIEILTQNFLHQDKLTSGEEQTALSKRTNAATSCRRGIAVTTLTLNIAQHSCDNFCYYLKKPEDPQF